LDASRPADAAALEADAAAVGPDATGPDPDAADPADPPDSAADAMMADEPATPMAGDLVVDPSTPHQAIDGFGASDAFSPSGALNPAEAQLLFDPVNGIGLSILRIGMDVDGSPLGSATLADVQLAASYGAMVWAAPWSPPANEKDNNNVDNGGHLCAEAGQASCTDGYYDAWANVLAAFPALVQAQTGVSLYGISAQNEPDFAATYVSCLFTGTQMVEFVKVLGPKLAALNPPVKLITAEPASWGRLWLGAEDCSGTNNYGTCIHADPAAEAAVDVFATHQYDFTPITPPSWVTKHVWETEVSGLPGNAQKGPSVDIANGLAVAGWVYDAILTGGVSAWHYWWLVSKAANNDNEGLLFPAGTGPGGVGDFNSPPKRLYTVGNFSKFVRPGYQRIDIAGTQPAGVRIVAFDNPADGTTVIVAMNNNTTSTAASFFVNGTAVPAAVTPWVTSASANLAPGAAIPVSGARFAAVLAPQSVTTFVGKPGVVAP
jgi:glucuronoarabinoxylan endo-1,4-beta-xylanase